ncbi:MAG: pilus assembly protein [Proteobacteria bacterium]|nr:pilus assembly protein [Pseudomonadota bacterium]
MRAIMCRSASCEHGGAAIEFAMVLPLFVLLLIGMLHFGLVLTTRYALVGAVYGAARTCTLARDPTQGCAQAAIAAQMAFNAGGPCGTLNVVAANADVAGYDGANAVRAFAVTATCSGGWALSAPFRAEVGASLDRFGARAVIPY